MKKSYVITAVVIIILSIMFPVFLSKYVGSGTDSISAGDILGYIGALIASIITILGLSWTFQTTGVELENRAGWMFSHLLV